MGEKPASYTERQYCAACLAFSQSAAPCGGDICEGSFHFENLRFSMVDGSTLSPRPFPVLEKGAALEDIPPVTPPGMAQPGPAVKGKPPLAVLRTLDGQHPAMPQYGRRRGIIRQSHERGDDKNLGTSCPKVDYFSISFFLSGLPSSGGCLAFQSSSRDMI